MRHIFLLSFMLSILSAPIQSQDDVHKQLEQAALLEQRGQYDQAIRGLRSLLDKSANGVIGETGQIWTMLGIAYEDQGHFQKAQNAYEQAIQILAGDAKRLSQYADVLDVFAGLNFATQRPEIATKLWAKAIAIHQQLTDHRALAKDYNYLAVQEMRTKHTGAAKQRLQQAMDEAKLATDLKEDDSVFLSDTQGWIANLEGDAKSELAAYLRSLEIDRRSHGDECPRTAWAYLFLGNAYANNNNIDLALTNMRQGLAILSRTVGQTNPQYFTGEVLLAKVLKRSGLREESARLEMDAERGIKEIHRDECIGCTVSVAGLR